MTMQQVLNPQQATSNFVGQSFQLAKDYTYPLAYSYSGPAEYCRFSFSLLPDQIPGGDWITQQLIGVLASKMVANGREMLELKIWEDKAPIWHTDYICDITYTDTGASTSALGTFIPAIAHVGAIIAAVLVILFIVAITFLIHEINKIWYGGNGTPGLGSTIMMLMPMFLLMMMMLMITPMMATGKETKEIEQGGENE